MMFRATRLLRLQRTIPKRGGGGRTFNKDWTIKITEAEKASLPAETLAEIQSSNFNTTFNMVTDYGKLNCAKAILTFYALIFVGLKLK